MSYGTGLEDRSGHLDRSDMEQDLCQVRFRSGLGQDTSVQILERTCGQISYRMGLVNRSSIGQDMWIDQLLNSTCGQVIYRTRHEDTSAI